MSNLTMLNDIALLPKSIEYCGETFMFNTWITFKGKLCIGLTTIENAFNELYNIVISGNYKLK